MWVGGNMGTPGSPATPLLRLIMLTLGDVIDWKEAVILSFTNTFFAQVSSMPNKDASE